MTSPALFVLSLALVCSIFGLASEQADHDRRPRSKMSIPDYDLAMGNRWTEKLNRKYIDYNENIDEVTPKHDEIYKGDDTSAINLNLHREKVKKMDREMRNFDATRDNVKKFDRGMRNFDATRDNVKKFDRGMRNFNVNNVDVKSRVKRDDNDYKCENFQFDEKVKVITHPHPADSSNYYNSTNCVTKINATSINMVIELTFVDYFRIEYHPECAYDYLEIRDGYFGYADLLGRFCGQAFPRTLKTKGPNVWLKFHSDDTIEYEGFKININFLEGPSHFIPESCYIILDSSNFGFIDTTKIDPMCLSQSPQALDVLWTITVPEDKKIYLNFTIYELAKPNECNENVIQVFETVNQELDSKLAEYCGSVANSVTTKDKNGHIMYIRLYATKGTRDKTKFNATYNAYRILDPSKEDGCTEDEFDCQDNTCIHEGLKCDGDAHCRLKADEDKGFCDLKTESVINQLHILVILVIFSLILSGMCFVFIFKCIRKLYQDHKIIKEHIRQSCEDRLDNLVGSRLTLDPKRLQRDSEPRASLERENHNNEMVKKQRSFSKHKQSSIESDFQETHLDLDEEIWRRDVDSMPIQEDVRIERNGRTRKSDFSRKEESIRSKTKESEDSKEKKEIRDVSVGAPDTKESGCQTRESLFQTDPPPSSDGSGSNSRGFSTFGYSGATIVRPSPPAATNTSEITIELLKQIPPEPKSQKKIADRRPISTETTRSAPDVIIVSKPIR